MSAALQHLDLDVYADMWMPPASLIDKHRLKGTPQHGIGRSCKAGKEEIVGLLTALRLFVAEGDTARHSRWCAILSDVRDRLATLDGVSCTLHGADDETGVPILSLAFRKKDSAARVALELQRQTPAIHVDAFHRGSNRLAINPLCLGPQDIAPLTEGLQAALNASGIR